jgi:hypothetical protein
MMIYKRMIKRDREDKELWKELLKQAPQNFWTLKFGPEIFEILFKKVENSHDFG